VNTHSVNISADVEEVLALFQVKLMPVSAGSPQEMAFAESKVRVIKRMSTAMLLGAPHLPQNTWACSDQYSNFLSDFLPIQTRQNECSFYMRTGKMVDWALLKIKCFGAHAFSHRSMDLSINVLRSWKKDGLSEDNGLS
jgi:hypothetical protein